MIQSATYGSTSGKENYGLVFGHAYTVLGVENLSNGVRLVRVRNPWSSEKWAGAWSRHSELWTEALKAEVGETLSNDGEFFMTIEDYNDQFAYTTFNHDTTGWFNASFLKLGDDSQA